MPYILVVDDDTSCLFQLVDYITRVSNAECVITAPNGIIALELYSVMHRRISLIITDNCMPHMEGIELVKACKEIDPTVKIILMSAYSKPEFEAMVDTFISKEGQHKIGKEALALIDFHVEKGDHGNLLLNILSDLGMIKGSLLAV